VPYNALMKEFNENQHEQFVTELHLWAARYALFDELIDYHLNGDCSFDEAVAQYKHDAAQLV
jgi:hypothetical protein